MDNKFTVLSIEDSEADFILIKKALEKIPDIEIEVININNGRNALDYIYKKEGYEQALTPNIIILDINLPSVDGKEILKSIKKHETYKSIPVIIFSTSDYYDDIEEAYKLQANSYLTKTFSVEDLYKKIKTIGEYWLKSNKLPDINCFLPPDKEEK